MADAVRTTIASAASLPKRRTVDEQLLVRWPGLYLRLARAFERMSPRSKIRRYLLRRDVVSTWRAWSRGDLDLVLGRYAQDAELHAIPNMIATGMDRTYEGHAGIRRLAADWGEAWGEMSVAPLEVWDFGDCAMTYARGRVQARGLEIGFEYDVHSVVWWRRGLVVRHRDFTNREEALRAIDAESAAASP
jgi:ketosteroid isomerase-like protein